MNNISPKEAVRYIEDSNVIVIDVRTPVEFEGGHIGGALNIDIGSMSFTDKLNELDKNEKYIINCQMGGRSARATSLMFELGFKNVMNLEGGITAWKRDGLSVKIG
ncbi:rhodanese-like domain-containing protein [Patescibacteria group bacterium]|nr:MAG: rhodanese-like domain-containing protein [Patescibacteria group bacterium]